MNDYLSEMVISALRTEQRNPDTIGIASLPTFGILEKINDLDQTVAPAVREALPQVALAVDIITEKMGLGGRLVYMGAGTSGRLGVVDASETMSTYGIDRVCCLIAGGRDSVYGAKSAIEDESELAVRDLEALGLSVNDVVFAIAASGRTPYCIAGLEYAAKVGAARIAFSCNKGAAMTKYAQVGIEVETGPEVVMGSTRMKAGTAQKMVTNMVTTAVMIQLGRTFDNLMININVGVKKSSKVVNRAPREFMEAVGNYDITYAKQALDKAGGSLEIAVLMELTGVTAEKAAEVLAECNRNFPKALGLLKR